MKNIQLTKKTIRFFIDRVRTKHTSANEINQQSNII